MSHEQIMFMALGAVSAIGLIGICMAIQRLLDAAERREENDVDRLESISDYMTLHGEEKPRRRVRGLS